MRKTSLILIAIIALYYFSCERDDICPDSTPTTPRLKIDLLDVANSDNKKNVFDLVIVGVTDEFTGVVSVNNEFILPDYNFRARIDSLLLPLKTTENSTQYVLIKEAEINDAGTEDDTSDDYIDGNQDLITINYSREEVYVSRACGYKTIFKNVTLNLDPDIANRWLTSRQPLTDNQSVEDETTPHFTMSH
ncbi:DUF6452 family protein [Flavivirga amylovorans]|uniref:DUF6452 family protein n=1 Tax=Flavivirga amylovorans TaxID=870486 RepID=A0ABT8X4C9_9FLAO|nr:DUF6452 family protein [Flavivirga amylovorans]MDO5988754.1 DUF6452 family protein [Flavivirga amylovorans]